jgi:putative transposase
MSSVFGHSFGPMAVMPSLTNDEAIIRLVGALILETNDEWAVARRYMSLETIARVTDNPTVRMPAVAT